ncbi:formate dehydrogenase accessory sulfurtransferase FdhD [Ignatzschineria sp. LJL83]
MDHYEKDMDGYEFCKKVNLLRYQNQSWEFIQDDVLLEMPVALIYNGYPHVVIMCTPMNLVDFVYGFSFTEGIVRNCDDIISIKLDWKSNGVEVFVEVPEYCVQLIKSRQRQMSARAGCGICGLDSLASVIRVQEKIDSEFVINEKAIELALEFAEDHQLMNRSTGGAHATFFVNLNGEILFSKEDVGRHVALDKLIGMMLRKNIDPSKGFILTTSRASFEMVQKVVSSRVGLLVAMSAPTVMAIDLAREMNLKLVAFARRGKINLYQ